MKVSVSEAKAQLTELVRRAEAGDEVVLTRHGQPTIRLVPVTSPKQPELRRKIIMDLRREAIRKVKAGPDAARSQDFLYDENGLPK